jgi:hypothetical protein
MECHLETSRYRDHEDTTRSTERRKDVGHKPQTSREIPFIGLEKMVPLSRQKRGGNHVAMNSSPRRL